MTTQQELQSLLLRLSVLLASSLSTLREPLPPTILDPSSSNTYSADKLSAQILNDINLLLTSVQKCCTNLTLALKPSQSAAKSASLKPGDSFTPTDGLDSASLDAAKAQLDDLTKEHIPKLTYLSRKASSEAVVYEYVAKTEDDISKEQEERELVMSKGGHIVQQLYSRDKEKLQKIKGKGLGTAWSKAIVAVIFELQEALGELSETFMSEQTLTVLQKASDARTKANAQKQMPSLLRKPPKTRGDARQRALQATSKVWSVCDGALKGKLPKNNRVAVRRLWEIRTELLEDARREYTRSLLPPRQKDDESRESDEEATDSDDEDFYEDDEYRDWIAPTEEQKEAHAMYDPFIRTAIEMHAKVGEICLTQEVILNGKIDLDELNEEGDDMSEALDDLIGAISYGVRGEDDDVAAEEEEEAKGEFEQATQRLYLMAARLDVDDALEPIHDKFVSAAKGVELLY